MSISTRNSAGCANTFSSDNEALRILLIDDDAVFKMVTAKRLEATGFDVDCAADAQSAYAMLARDHYDLAIVDLSMPELDGLDFIGSLRNSSSTYQLPIIVVTASTAIGDLRSAMELDVCWFVNKPINWVLFNEQVNQAISGACYLSQPDAAAV